MKKFTMATIPLLCAAISPLCADSMGYNNKNRNASSQATMQPTSQITPSANPMVTRCADPFLTADFIWWKAQEDGLDFAYTGAATTANGPSVSRGHVYRPGFKFEPGFKVGFGLKFRHDGWDLYANYTWLRNNFEQTEKSVHSSSSSNLAGNFLVQSGQPVYVTTASKAKSEWALHLNVLDAELGRNYWISQWLTLRPHFGMKFSWNSQDFNVKYEGATLSDSVSPVNLKLDNDQDQWCVGLRTGLDTAWYMWKKWCIFGEFAVSALWNHFEVTRKDTTQRGTGTFTSLNTGHHYFVITPVVEMALGLRFETAFYNDDYLFMLQAGWEEQIWFNQNQFFFIDNHAQANLTFQGLTIKAGFDF